MRTSANSSAHTCESVAYFLEKLEVDVSGHLIALSGLSGRIIPSVHSRANGVGPRQSHLPLFPLALYSLLPPLPVIRERVGVRASLSTAPLSTALLSRAAQGEGSSYFTVTCDYADYSSLSRERGFHFLTLSVMFPPSAFADWITHIT